MCNLSKRKKQLTWQSRRNFRTKWCSYTGISKPNNLGFLLFFHSFHKIGYFFLKRKINFLKFLSLVAHRMFSIRSKCLFIKRFNHFYISTPRMWFGGGSLNIYLVHTSVDAKLSPLFTARCFAALLVILALVGMLGLSTDEELSLLLNAWD